jgi:hypothetical protein
MAVLRIVGGALLGSALALASSVDFSAAERPSRVHAPRIRAATNGTSTNWSGYSVTQSGPVTHVSGSWVVPAVTGSPSSYSSFWVGIDGDGSNTVEQIGTDSDIDSSGRPQYYAWFEFYPKASMTIRGMDIQVGDVMSATVDALGGGQFRVSMTNARTGANFTTTQRVNRARMASAEWIAEAPSSGGVLPLANFGSVDFTSCMASINYGTPQPISAFGANIDPITMVISFANPTAEATPTGLTATGDGFTVNVP